MAGKNGRSTSGQQRKHTVRLVNVYQKRVAEMLRLPIGPDNRVLCGSKPKARRTRKEVRRKARELKLGKIVLSG